MDSPWSTSRLGPHLPTQSLLNIISRVSLYYLSQTTTLVLKLSDLFLPYSPSLLLSVSPSISPFSFENFAVVIPISWDTHSLDILKTNSLIASKLYSNII